MVDLDASFVSVARADQSHICDRMTCIRNEKVVNIKYTSLAEVYAVSKASLFSLIAKANSQARSECFSNIVIRWKFSQRACELAFAMSGKEP